MKPKRQHIDLPPAAKKKLAQGAVDLAVQMGYLDELRTALAAVIAKVPVPSTVKHDEED